MDVGSNRYKLYPYYNSFYMFYKSVSFLNNWFVCFDNTLFRLSYETSF